MILETGVIPKLIELLQKPEIVIINPTLRILGNITHGTDDDTQVILDANIMPS